MSLVSYNEDYCMHSLLSSLFIVIHVFFTNQGVSILLIQRFQSMEPVAASVQFGVQSSENHPSQARQSDCTSVSE